MPVVSIFAEKVAIEKSNKSSQLRLTLDAMIDKPTVPVAP